MVYQALGIPVDRLVTQSAALVAIQENIAKLETLEATITLFKSLENSNAFSSYSQDHYVDIVDIVISNLTRVIKEIYKKGGKKFGGFRDSYTSLRDSETHTNFYDLETE
ncbi:hypothetical protein L6164_002071 [Bauhinia variegata]|uniref:Uncharacterized protein n=1 Tax=Bauhinia variegata TaxID=167791 RepID=A0ACB9PWJ3_BAUVA|nr:hypothetical protein L6164_002071 [Bauhinia variegata]